MSMIELAKNILTNGKSQKKQQWMRDEILDLTEKRRLDEGKCEQQFIGIHK